jgi:hypothetical protein
MDGTPHRYARRCLPLMVANQYGWTLHLPAPVHLAWTGDQGIPALTVQGPATSHFGSGVVTFHPPYLFRTDPGWDLWARGPSNQPVDGLGPLEGIIETDWSSMPFTMNWKLTRPGSVSLPAGFPYCHVVPVPKGALQATQPVVRDLTDDPQTLERFEAWRRSRSAFNADQDRPAAAWERHYHAGRHATGEPGAAPGEHVTRVRCPHFQQH